MKFAQIFMLLLTGAAGIDAGHAQAGPTPEIVGRPFADIWPDAPYARNIWSMTVHNNRLYFGAGNSSNIGPSPNAGPVPVISYGRDGFRRELTLDEEQLAVFHHAGGHLYIPGHDTTESWDFGNVYRLDDTGWRKFRTVPHGLHVYDIHRFAGRLVAAGGAYNQPIDGWISRDDGATWHAADLLPNPAFATPANPGGVFKRLVGNGFYGRLYTLFDIAGTLYASAAAPLEPAEGWDQPPMTATLFAFDGRQGFRPVTLHPATVPAPHRAAFTAESVMLFPEIDRHMTDSGDTTIPIVARDAHAGPVTIYIGAWMHNDHQWRPFGLFAATDTDTVSRVRLPEGFLPHDLLVHDGTLYVLANRRLAENRFEAGILKRRDISQIKQGQTEWDQAHWDIAATFTAGGPARSFALYHGDLYIGLGAAITDPSPGGPDAEMGWSRELSPDAGTILRFDGHGVGVTSVR